MTANSLMLMAERLYDEELISYEEFAFLIALCEEMSEKEDL